MSAYHKNPILGLSENRFILAFGQFCASKTTMKSIFSLEYNVFRQCMIAARKKADFTQANLAKALGKPQSFVAKYENGERRLDVIEFLIITHAIGVDPYEILRKVEKSFDSKLSQE